MQNLIVGVCGRKGSGKSTVARDILQRCPRLFVWDPMAEHQWIPNRFRSLESVDEFLAWSEGQDRFAGGFIPDSLEDDFEPVAETVYGRGSLVFAIEEAPMICNPSFLPPELDRAVRLGRHRRLNILWTAQRMVETSRRLTSATDWFILFRHTEPRDLDGIAERCGSAVAERVSTLPLHGYLVWDVIEGRESKKSELMARILGRDDKNVPSSMTRGNVIASGNGRDRQGSAIRAGDR